MASKIFVFNKAVAVRVYVDISVDSHVAPEGNAENCSAIGVVLADHDYH